mgnify:CR=1 FL=1
MRIQVTDMSAFQTYRRIDDAIDERRAFGGQSCTQGFFEFNRFGDMEGHASEGFNQAVVTGFGHQHGRSRIAVLSLSLFLSRLLSGRFFPRYGPQDTGSRPRLQEAGSSSSGKGL